MFYQNGFNLEGGLLALLAQFKQGDVRFLLSEIVLREVRRQMETQAKKASDEFAAAIHEFTKYGLLAAELEQRLKDIKNSAVTPEEAVSARLESFLTKTGAVVVEAAMADMQKLVEGYFTPLAPFEATGKKKNEFPDAIALLSLASWAAAHEHKVLAVSDDKGWDNFATDLDWLTVEKGLATALDKLQQYRDEAEALVRRVVADLVSGQNQKALQEIRRRVKEAVLAIHVDVEASSRFQFDVDGAELIFRRLDFHRGTNGYEFNIVQADKERIVASIPITITAAAQADFSLEIWDSIDREYVPMGSTSSLKMVDFDSVVLVTLEGEFGQGKAEYDVADVELVDVDISSVDFGEIKLDHDDEFEDVESLEE